MSIYLTYLLISLGCFALFEAIRHSFVLSGRIWYLSAETNKGSMRKILDIFYQNAVRFTSVIKICIITSFLVYIFSALTWIETDPLFIQTNLLEKSGVMLLLSLGLVIFGLIIPHLISSFCIKQVMNIFSIPLVVIYFILSPLADLWNKSLNVLDRLFHVKSHTDFITKAFFDKESFDTILLKSMDDTQRDTTTIEKDVKILQNALEFSNIRLRDCIVPRTEIVASDKNVQLKELISMFTETGFSKILIYDEDIDHVLGYVHSSELFNNPDNWLEHLNAVPIVPETMAAKKLMKTLMQTKKSMAVVVDEFGGTAGIVTLEDLVEEIFGEIEDEHDQPQHIAKKVGDDEYILSGRIEIDTLNETFDLDLPESDDYVTVAGFILHYYQRLPKLNEKIIIDKYSFKIVKVTETKIEMVRLQVLPSPPDYLAENN